MAIEYNNQTEIEALSSQNRDTSRYLSDQRVSMFGSARLSEIAARLGGGRIGEAMASYIADCTSALTTSIYPRERRRNFHLTDDYLLQKIKSMSGLVGYWPLNEVTSGSARDYSGNGNHGTTTTALVAQSGQSGRAYTFGGASTDQVVTGYSTHNQQVSYVALVYKTGNGGGNLGRVFDKRVSGAQSEVMFWSTASTLEYNRQFSGGNAIWNVTDVAGLNAWQMIGLTYNSSSATNDPIFYINGVARSLAGDTNSTGTVSDNADAYVIGNRASDSLRNFAGKMQHFAIFNRILTATEMLNLAQIAGVA